MANVQDALAGIETSAAWRPYFMKRCPYDVETRTVGAVDLDLDPDMSRSRLNVFIFIFKNQSLVLVHKDS
jgi:hypothetical protein